MTTITERMALCANEGLREKFAYVLLERGITGVNISSELAKMIKALSDINTNAKLTFEEITDLNISDYISNNIVVG